MCRHADCGALTSTQLRSNLIRRGACAPADGADHETPIHPCFCLLARAIGFSDDVLTRFKRRAEIHVVRSTGAADEGSEHVGGSELPLLMAVIVEDEAHNLQIFCRGQARAALPSRPRARDRSAWD